MSVLSEYVFGAHSWSEYALVGKRAANGGHAPRIEHPRKGEQASTYEHPPTKSKHGAVSSYATSEQHMPSEQAASRVSDREDRPIVTKASFVSECSTISKPAGHT